MSTTTNLTKIPQQSNTKNLRKLQNYHYTNNKNNTTHNNNTDNALYAQAVYSLHNQLPKTNETALTKRIDAIIELIETNQKYKHLTKYKTKTLNLSEIVEILQVDSTYTKCENCIFNTENLNIPGPGYRCTRTVLISYIATTLKETTETWAQAYLHLIELYTDTDHEIHKLAKKHVYHRDIFTPLSNQTINVLKALARTICITNITCETCPLKKTKDSEGIRCIKGILPLTRNAMIIKNDQPLSKENLLLEIEK